MMWEKVIPKFMRTLHFGGIKPILDIVSPNKLQDYYANPQLLEDRVSEYVGGNWADKKYSDSINLGTIKVEFQHWHDDLVKLIDKWVADQPKDDKIIDRWCSAMDYVCIKERYFKAQYPDYNVTEREMNAFCPTTTNTIDAAPHWRVIRDGEKYEILIDDTKDLLASFNQAICRLFLSHLFYCIHAGYDDLKGYELGVYKSLS